MDNERLVELFMNYLGVEEDYRETWSIVEDLRAAGATNEDLEYLGYDLEMEN